MNNPTAPYKTWNKPEEAKKWQAKLSKTESVME
jgi:hypothetical protein